MVYLDTKSLLCLCVKCKIWYENNKILQTYSGIDYEIHIGNKKKRLTISTVECVIYDTVLKALQHRQTDDLCY